MELSKPSKDSEFRVDNINVSVKNKTSTLSNTTYNNILHLFEVKSKSYGTIEGKLEMVSERHGLKFIVTDPITDRGIKCNFDEKMLKDIVNAFDKRVSVYGLIRYNKNGDPLEVAVEEFRKLRERDQLPTSYDVRSILTA